MALSCLLSVLHSWITLKSLILQRIARLSGLPIHDTVMKTQKKILCPGGGEVRKKITLILCDTNQYLTDVASDTLLPRLFLLRVVVELWFFFHSFFAFSPVVSMSRNDFLTFFMAHTISVVGPVRRRQLLHPRGLQFHHTQVWNTRTRRARAHTLTHTLTHSILSLSLSLPD